ncbi:MULTISPECIES: ATP-binding protein [unclassified Shewanella]|uniref:ATP-binding protein n=1 Tax=unclassified Shewanella TaxID=196818 RepID=UPI002158D4E9|nr:MULTISPECIES: ATP-binding protein [unclassified Shewanella]
MRGFFSTGLGLSLSYSIVQKHKGEIKVTSTLGEGTSFTVILPILTPADVSEC